MKQRRISCIKRKNPLLRYDGQRVPLPVRRHDGGEEVGHCRYQDKAVVLSQSQQHVLRERIQLQLVRHSGNALKLQL
jgi:hypothetical protein